MGHDNLILLIHLFSISFFSIGNALTQENHRAFWQCLFFTFTFVFTSLSICSILCFSICSEALLGEDAVVYLEYLFISHLVFVLFSISVFILIRDWEQQRWDCPYFLSICLDVT